MRFWNLGRHGTDPDDNKDVGVFSHKILRLKTCSMVLLPGFELSLLFSLGFEPVQNDF